MSINLRFWAPKTTCLIPQDGRELLVGDVPITIDVKRVETVINHGPLDGADPEVGQSVAKFSSRHCSIAVQITLPEDVYKPIAMRRQLCTELICAADYFEAGRPRAVTHGSRAAPRGVVVPPVAVKLDGSHL